MYKQLAAIYHRLSSIPAVRWTGRRYLQGMPAGNLLAYSRLAKTNARKAAKKLPATVVFVQQHKANWDIVRDLYEAMRDDDRFETHIVAVEEPRDSDHDASYRLLAGLYGADSVIKAERGSDLFDLKSLDPDYVFLPRPYDQYLPKSYRSANVSKYASVAYLPYGVSLFADVEDDAFNGRFCRNVSTLFADSNYIAQKQLRRYPRSHEKGIRKTVMSGSPYLASYAQLEPVAHDGFNVLWTPRWGEEPEIGGSNFIPFKDQFIALAKAAPEFTLIFRPHPLMFEHFISTGRLSQEEADAYLSQFSDEGPLRYDATPSVRESFAASDVLVTDVSSIIVPYLATGKPIIYCDTGAHLNQVGEEALEAMYAAKDFDDVLELLVRLEQGQDPLLDVRVKKAKELFFPEGKDSSTLIMDVLLQGYDSTDGR